MQSNQRMLYEKTHIIMCMIALHSRQPWIGANKQTSQNRGCGTAAASAGANFQYIIVQSCKFSYLVLYTPLRIKIVRVQCNCFNMTPGLTRRQRCLGEVTRCRRH